MALVVWIDHVKSSEDPSAEGMAPVKRNTVGWIIEETDEHIVTAHSLDEDPKKTQYEFGFGISKKMVEAITKLGPLAKRGAAK